MAKRIALFSLPTPKIFENLKTMLFPAYLEDKVVAYMPSDGADQKSNDKFNPIWKSFIESNGGKFCFIDNSKRDDSASKESDKVLSANVLVITGGNTFTLINHLRQSGLDQTILKFWQKDNVVLSGFSAGALVLTPSIEIAASMDENLVEISDLSGLKIVNFEVWPHFEEEQRKQLEEYQSYKNVEVKPISNESILIIDY